MNWKQNTWSLLLFSALFFGCKQPGDVKEDAPDDLSWVNNATIYEVNLRHYSEEGSIAGFIPHIDRLKELGVNILWFMPIQPIGAINRKAKGDVFVHEIADSLERKKYLGSPYSISDYRAVNPDYGSLAEFKKLVEICHSKGLKVMIDWVGNHTAWDHAWIKAHPDWYTQKDGKITDPLNEKGESIGWTDVADLNYGNRELWKAMASDMKFWVEECDIDGFRCDVAFEIPAAFWDTAVIEIKKVKNVFMLAEAEGHKMEMYNGTFQAYYAWNVHHQMNQLAQGKITAHQFYRECYKVDSMFGDRAFPMNFITNHDENSWNGTEFERMGSRWETMAVMSYALKGMPLLYTGQEVGLNHRLKFFEKDLVNWKADSAAFYTGFYQKLNALKADQRMAVDADFAMMVDGDLITIQRGTLTFWFNFSGQPLSFETSKQSKIVLGQLKDGKIPAWGYLAVDKG